MTEDKYSTSKEAIGKELENLKVALTSDILTVTNSTRSFLVLIVHYIINSTQELQSVCFAAKKLSEVSIFFLKVMPIHLFCNYLQVFMHCMKFVDHFNK